MILLDVLSGRKPARLPVWFEAHSGLYDTAFRAAKEEHGWSGLFGNPEVAAELSINSAQNLDLDGITAYTHPLSALTLLDLTPVLSDDGHPALESHIHSPAQIRAMHIHPPGTLLNHDADVLARIKEGSGNRTVIARHAGPFTLLGHIIEGKAPWHARLRALLFQYPSEARVLLTHAVGALIAWAQAMAAVGADALYLEESWASLVGPEDQAIFIVPWLENIVRRIAPLPVIIKAPTLDYEIGRFHKAGVAAWLPDQHTTSDRLREETHWSTALLGPFDAGRLLSTPPVIAQTAGRLVERYGDRDFIVSLASPPLPHTDVRNLKTLVDTIHAYKTK